MYRETAALLSKQFLAEWRSVLKDMCGGNGAVAEGSYSIFTFLSLQSLPLAAWRFMKLCPVICLPMRFIATLVVRLDSGKAELAEAAVDGCVSCSIGSH